MNKNLAKQINKMAEIDQEAVRKRQIFGIVNKRLISENTKKMKEIVSRYGWPTISLVGKKASKNAWLLVQHADDDLTFQQKCLTFMKKIYQKNPKEIYPQHIAFLTDRILVNKGKKQLFGTQFYTNKKGVFTHYPIKDIKNVDKRRKAYGIPPLEEYIKAARLHKSAPIKKVIK